MTRIPFAPLVAFGPALFLACGAPNSFEGTVDRHTLSVSDAIFVEQKTPDGVTWEADLWLSDRPKICDLVTGGSSVSNATLLLIRLTPGDGGALTAPERREYGVRSGTPVAQADFAVTDANCMNRLIPALASAESGRVTVAGYKAESGGALTGKFDLTFGPQHDKVRGVFNAPYCGVAPLMLRKCE